MSYVNISDKIRQGAGGSYEFIWVMYPWVDDGNRDNTSSRRFVERSLEFDKNSSNIALVS